MRYARHASAGRCQFCFHLGITLRQHRNNVGMFTNAHTKSRRNRVRRDVIMRRADAPGREDIRIGGTKFVHRLHDTRLHICDCARFHDRNAERRKIFCDLLEIYVAGTAREDFIANQKDGGSGLVIGHAN